jgi:UDP-N-acetylmuramoyl-tripeptide--D-alanyl-D-alanine ligase
MKNLFKKSIVAILTFEAKILLKRHKPRIVAITGSVGKTSTKDAIYVVLKNHLHTRKSEKSFNSDIGVALTVLGLHNGMNNPFLWIKNIVDGALHAIFTRHYPEVLVLEMGVDRKGDMKRLTQWIKPDVVVLTRLPDVPAHVEYFTSPQEVVDEKMTLVYALTDDGAFVYNNDDEKIQQYLPEVRQNAFGFSRYSLSHFTASADTVIYDGASPIGMEFTLTHVKDRVKTKVLGSLGVQHTYIYGAAVAMGSLFGISLEDAAHALTTHTPPPGRMRVLQGIKNTVVIDDTYNSSPVAAEHAIQSLHELKTTGRKIAVLGDMLELGQFSVREHEKVGEFLSKKVDMLFTIGVRARKIAEGALELGLSEKVIFQYDDIEKLIEELRPQLQANDIVLVKASQGIRAEKVVRAIMREPEKAEELLVRQDDIWEQKL